MEQEILETLQTMRGYLFVIMVFFILWVLFKIVDIVLNYLDKWIKAWDSHFESQTARLLDKGEYEEAIQECKSKLEAYPNHLDAIWLLARAYYYTEQYDLARQCFEKAVYISPSWESNAESYLAKIPANNPIKQTQ